MQGEILPSASQVSTTQPKSTNSSLKHSLRSNRQDSLHLHRSSLGSDLLKDQPTKIRPALSPTLFNPTGAESGYSPFSKQFRHTALMEKLQELYDEAETMDNGDGNFVQSSDHTDVFAQRLDLETSEKANFLKRLKFKKKLMSGAKPGKKFKAKKNQSDAHSRGTNIVAPVQPSTLPVSPLTESMASDQDCKLTPPLHKISASESIALPVTRQDAHFPAENTRKIQGATCGSNACVSINCTIS